MRVIRAIVPFAALAVFVGASAAASPAFGAPRDLALGYDPETLTVRVGDVTSATPYVDFTVPDCVEELAYVMDGGAGGSSRRVGTNQYAPGGAGAVRSGTVTVTPGEHLRLYPAAQGVSAQLNSDIGDAGGGGTIGFRPGGGGTGRDEGAGLWTVRQNAGGGGGASSALTLGTTPIVVAAGGGGAGGSAWNDLKNTGIGGAGDTRGGDGVNFAGSGGALGAGASGAGLRGADPSANAGGSGGGGGGYLGGGAGRTSGLSTQGGGGGAGGTSYLDASRVSTSTISDYGLSTDDVVPTGDGAVTIAWFGCASILTLTGTTTDRSGVTAPAAGWESTVTAPDVTLDANRHVLDEYGEANVIISGYEFETDVSAVTVTQETRPGWVLRTWDDENAHALPATCTAMSDPDEHYPVTAIDAHSFRVDVPAGTWVHCTFDTVEAAPDMTVIAQALLLPTLETAPHDVRSGDDVEFSYDIRNTGNMPLDIAISDTRNDALTCAQPTLLPGEQTSCTGSIPLTRD